MLFFLARTSILIAVAKSFLLKAKVNAAVTAVMGEIRGMADGVSDEELNRSVEFACGRLDLRLEDTRAVMGWMGGQELLREEVITPDEVVAELRAITTDQIRTAAKRYLSDGAYRLAVVGPFRSEGRFLKLIS